MAREGKITRTEVRFGVDNDQAGSTYQRGAETAVIAPERSWRIMALFIVIPPCGAAWLGFREVPKAAIGNLRRDRRSASIAPTPSGTTRMPSGRSSHIFARHCLRSVARRSRPEGIPRSLRSPQWRGCDQTASAMITLAGPANGRRSSLRQPVCPSHTSA